MTRVLFFTLLCLAGCIPSTGGKRVGFQVVAVGEPAAAAFDAPSGFSVTLTRASLFVGAVYLNQSNPANYSQETACILPGIYTGEVRGGVTVDALSAKAQPFAVDGSGTTTPTRAAELWLTADDVNASGDKTVVFDVAGTATRGSERYPFEGKLTIGSNRVTPPRNPALPGADPLCKQRIISPIPTEITLAEGGTLVLHVDVRHWFDSVDFSTLSQVQDTPPSFEFLDSTVEGGQADVALYNSTRAASDQTYRFEWQPGGS